MTVDSSDFFKVLYYTPVKNSKEGGLRKPLITVVIVIIVMIIIIIILFCLVCLYEI
jgi:hypothetical protein